MGRFTRLIQRTLYAQLSTKKSQLPEAFTLQRLYTAYISGRLLMFWDRLISPIFKGQFFGFLDTWNWTNRLSQNDDKYQPMPSNIPNKWNKPWHKPETPPIPAVCCVCGWVVLSLSRHLVVMMGWGAGGERDTHTHTSCLWCELNPNSLVIQLISYFLH